MNTIIKRASGILSLAIMINLSLAKTSQSSDFSIRISKNSTQTCQQAIDSVASELRRRRVFNPIYVTDDWNSQRIVPNVMRRNDSVHYYLNHPPDRLESVHFIMNNNQYQIEAIHNSPQFVTIMASRIISACPTIGLVFYSTWFEQDTLVGYFPDNTVRLFTAVDPYDSRQGRWGFYFDS